MPMVIYNSPAQITPTVSIAPFKVLAHGQAPLVQPPSIFLRIPPLFTIKDTPII